MAESDARDQATQATPTEKQSKALKEAFSEMKSFATEGVPEIAAVLQGMEAIQPVLAPLQMFFNMMTISFQAGLAPAVEAMSKALFTEENVKTFSKLAEVTGKLMAEAIVPLCDYLGKALPVINPAIEKLTYYMDKFDGATTALSSSIKVLDKALGSVDDVVGDLKKTFDKLEDVMKPIIDAIKKVL